VVKLFESVTLDRFVHPQNAEPVIAVTLLGITILVNALQSLNASSPISVTLSGIIMLDSFVHPSNA
jgi:hypothetical protein